MPLLTQMARFPRLAGPAPLLVFGIVLLAGCATGPIVSEAPAEPGTTLDSDVEDVAGNSVVEVRPLAEPGVAPLLARASEAEARGELVAARQFLDRALELAPRDPAVWQRVAELSLLAGEWRDAAEAARRSFDGGPKVGRLCVRNWLTMARAFEAQGFAERATHAKSEAQDCPVRPRERL